MTGFRVSLAGAQAYYGVTPDLTHIRVKSLAAVCQWVLLAVKK